MIFSAPFSVFETSATILTASELEYERENRFLRVLFDNRGYFALRIGQIKRNLIAHTDDDKFRSFFAKSFDFGKGFHVAGCDCDGKRVKIRTA